MTRKIKGTLSKDKFDGELIEFIRHFFNKWKSRTIFQVLLQYRAARFQDFYNLSQQVGVIYWDQDVWCLGETLFGRLVIWARGRLGARMFGTISICIIDMG